MEDGAEECEDASIADDYPVMKGVTVNRSPRAAINGTAKSASTAEDFQQGQKARDANVTFATRILSGGAEMTVNRSPRAAIDSDGRLLHFLNTSLPFFCLTSQGT